MTKQYQKGVTRHTTNNHYNCFGLQASKSVVREDKPIGMESDSLWNVAPNAWRKMYHICLAMPVTLDDTPWRYFLKNP